MVFPEGFRQLPSYRAAESQGGSPLQWATTPRPLGYDMRPLRGKIRRSPKPFRASTSWLLITDRLITDHFRATPQT